MLINATEKQWFEAIDGTCKIGDIVGKTPPTSQISTQLEWRANFFERLWWYDQVVFDASYQ